MLQQRSVFDLSSKDRLRQVVHNLIGSGATYGFPEISSAARVVEELLAAQQASFPSQKASAWNDQLITALDALIQACDLTAEEGSQKPILAAPEFSSQAEDQAEISLPEVWVVDDDPSIQGLLAYLLRHDAKIEIFESAQHVCTRLKQKLPALMILDDMLPGMSGQDLLRELHGDPVWKEIPIIMLTANDRSQSILSGILSGAVDYIVKPFDGEHFLQLIRDRLQRATKRVLIVDDDPAIRDLLSYKFRVEGCQTLVSGLGKQGLEMAKEYHPHLIILDIMLPDIDGLLVLQNLKKMPECSEIPILFLTVKQQEVDIVKGLCLGASDYVTKPFLLNELVARSFKLMKVPRKFEGKPCF